MRKSKYFEDLVKSRPDIFKAIEKVDTESLLKFLTTLMKDDVSEFDLKVLSYEIGMDTVCLLMDITKEIIDFDSSKAWIEFCNKLEKMVEKKKWDYILKEDNDSLLGFITIDDKKYFVAYNKLIKRVVRFDSLNSILDNKEYNDEGECTCNKDKNLS